MRTVCLVARERLRVALNAISFREWYDMAAMEPQIQYAKTEDGKHEGEVGFRVILSSLYLLVVVVRLYYMRRGSKSAQTISRTREERLTLPLLASINVLGTGAGLVYVFAPQRMKWATLPVPVWSRWVGVGLGVASLPLFAWTHHALGKNWSLALVTKEEHTLVSSGPYRWVRHPMYTVIFLQGLAFFLLSANWVIGISGLVTSTLCVARVRDEEGLMVEEFGDQYRAYMERTGRFLPSMKVQV